MSKRVVNPGATGEGRRLTIRWLEVRGTRPLLKVGMSAQLHESKQDPRA